MNEHTKISEGAIFFNNSTTRAKSQRKMMLLRKPHSPHEVVFNPDPEFSVPTCLNGSGCTRVMDLKLCIVKGITT